MSIRLEPDGQGKFGFNVKGGHDMGCAVLVSRVAPGWSLLASAYSGTCSACNDCLRYISISQELQRTNATRD